jgi:hypothetical protein
MVALAQKIAAEHHTRALLEDHGLSQPDEVEYGLTCVRLIWHEQRLCLIVEIEEPPPSWSWPEGVDDQGVVNTRAAEAADENDARDGKGRSRKRDDDRHSRLPDGGSG